jgi:hypothetical protein
MLDIFFVVVSCLFFGLSIAYTYGCDRLRAGRRPLPNVGGHHD